MYYGGNYKFLPYHICFLFSKHTHVLDVLSPTLHRSTIVLFEIDWSHGVSYQELTLCEVSIVVKNVLVATTTIAMVSFQSSILNILAFLFAPHQSPIFCNICVRKWLGNLVQMISQSKSQLSSIEFLWFTLELQVTSFVGYIIMLAHDFPHGYGLRARIDTISQEDVTQCEPFMCIEQFQNSQVQCVDLDFMISIQSHYQNSFCLNVFIVWYIEL